MKTSKNFQKLKILLLLLFRPSLRDSLEQGKKIIITIEKFPFMVDGIADLSDKRFAVVIDEAVPKVEQPQVK